MGFTKTESEMLTRMSIEKYELDRQSEISWARKQARKEGREEGLEEGRAERDQYFLQLLNQGLSIEEIKQRLGNN